MLLSKSLIEAGAVQVPLGHWLQPQASELDTVCRKVAACLVDKAYAATVGPAATASAPPPPVGPFSLVRHGHNDEWFDHGALRRGPTP